MRQHDCRDLASLGAMADPLPRVASEEAVPLSAEHDAANVEQLELIPVPRCSYCGPLQHTIDRWGRETHKCKCPYRTDPYCEAHPSGDCELPKPRWNPKWPLESLYGTTWEDAFACPSDDVDESASLKETA